MTGRNWTSQVFEACELEHILKEFDVFISKSNIACTNPSWNDCEKLD